MPADGGRNSLIMALTLTQRFSLQRFLRGEGPQNKPVTLNHRRIFILPSRAGLGLAVVMLLMLVASINYNNSMGFVLTFLLASAAQISTYYSFRNLSGLELKAGVSRAVFLGQTAKFEIQLLNRNGRNRWNVLIESGNAKNTIHSIAPSHNAVCHLDIATKQRGWLTLGSVTYSTTFPMGIFRAWSPVDLDQQILVYPRPAEDAPPLPLAPDRSSDNEQLSRQTGSDHFVGLRPYQHPDSYRQINWKVLARERGLYVNEFRAGTTQQLWLDWHQCAGKNPEQRLSILCRWVLDAEQRGLLYGLQIPGVNIEPASGPQHQTACLEALALWKRT